MLKYYAEEEARWGYLNDIEPNELQVVRAIRRWSDRYFSADTRKRGRLPFRVQFRASESAWSWATKDGITFTYPVNWLLVVHEFAHLIQWRRNYKPRIWHDDYHRRLVDELCRDIIKQGYDVDSLTIKP